MTERKGWFGFGGGSSPMQEADDGIDLLAQVRDQLQAFSDRVEDGRIKNIFYAMANSTAISTALRGLQDIQRQVRDGEDTQYSDTRPLTSKAEPVGAHKVYSGR